MDATFAEVKAKIVRVIADEVVADSNPLEGAQTPAALLADAVQAALTAISIKIWKASIKHIDPADGDGNVFSLPTGTGNVEGVYEIARVSFIPEIELRAGLKLADAISGNGWILYPDGKITLVNTLTSAGADLYFAGAWAIPEGEGDTLEPPEMALTPIILYAASYVFLNRASATADVRQYATKIDAGQPTDNPAKDISDFFLRRFESEMQKIPQRTRGITR